MQVFTLASGEYAYGACALINSLQRLGFSGEIHVGFQGKLNWDIAPGAPVVTHDLTGEGRWLGYAKPRLVLDHASGPFLYIDADCIIQKPVLFEWARGPLPLLCAEGIVPRNDFRRPRWRELLPAAHRAGQTGPASTDVYYNSGLIAGSLPRDAELLERWWSVIDNAVVGPGGVFVDPVIPLADQDCLNAVIQDGQFEFACMSPPDIWYAAASHNPFFHVGAMDDVVLHCTGEDKPWRLTSVPPRSPTRYDVAWYELLSSKSGWVRCGWSGSRALRSWFTRGPLGGVSRRGAQLRRRLR